MQQRFKQISFVTNNNFINNNNTLVIVYFLLILFFLLILLVYNKNLTKLKTLQSFVLVYAFISMR